ncbi:DUF4265 domain-containing protein [Actinotalea sp. AC32]|nr:DUF4265 domain-containing protein [Actinotalea sp. AC32]
MTRRPPDRPDRHSHPVFSEMVQRSDHLTIRLVFLRSGRLRGGLTRAAEPFQRLGVYVEGVGQYGMLALDIKPSDPLDQIAGVLRAGEEDGSCEYEEGRISQAWVDAKGEGSTH